MGFVAKGEIGDTPALKTALLNGGQIAHPWPAITERNVARDASQETLLGLDRTGRRHCKGDIPAY